MAAAFDLFLVVGDRLINVLPPIAAILIWGAFMPGKPFLTYTLADQARAHLPQNFGCTDRVSLNSNKRQNADLLALRLNRPSETCVSIPARISECVRLNSKRPAP